MQRRSFLKLLAGGGVAAMLPRIGFATPGATQPFWVHVQATGGWDQALTWDPKASLRGPFLDGQVQIYGATVRKNGVVTTGTGIVTNPNASQLRQTPGGGIPYLGFADLYGDPNDSTNPYVCFLPTYYDRVTIFNGLDTGTNNHSVGTRYCATGSSNEGSPCFAAQVAAAQGASMPLAFIDYGGYDETAALLAATPINPSSLTSLLKLTNPNDISGDNSGTDFFVDQPSLNAIHAAHQQRLTRLTSQLKLPGQQRGLSALAAAEQAQAILSRLNFNAGYPTAQAVIDIGIEAYRKGLAASMNIPSGGFDSHMNNEQQQGAALNDLLEMVKYVLQQTESPANGLAPIPCVIVISTDFGRTPYRTNAGTDHWPTATMMVVQNTMAKQIGFNLPTNTVIGGTTDGDATTAIKPMKVNPQTLKLDSNGITLTPGHVMRGLRRMAQIDQSPVLAGFPVTVDQDLAIG